MYSTSQHDSAKPHLVNIATHTSSLMIVWLLSSQSAILCLDKDLLLTLIHIMLLSTVLEPLSRQLTCTLITILSAYQACEIGSETCRIL